MMLGFKGLKEVSVFSKFKTARYCKKTSDVDQNKNIQPLPSGETRK